MGFQIEADWKALSANQIDARRKSANKLLKVSIWKPALVLGTRDDILDH